ncbi:MAG: biotin/lipoyl-binding protein [Actinobacteria bacterium]|nr:biotin/lipoyl-binding protein [Actinomycetota bacterium]
MFNISSNKKFGNYFKVLILILIFFLTLSSVWLFSCRKTQSVPETAVALRGDIVQSVDVSGNVDSSQEKKLSLPASGKVLKSVEMGDTVKKGNILIEIDSRKTKLLISQAQENIKVADSSLKLAEVNYKAALDANHVAIQVAQENNKLAQQASDNALNNLENTNGAGNEAIDSANTNLSNAKNQSDISIHNALKTLQDAQNSYNSSINQAQTALDQAKYQLSKTSGSGSNNLQLSQYEAAVANAQAAYNVTAGASDFENTEIKSGIKEGDNVLLSKPEQSKNAFPLTQR